MARNVIPGRRLEGWRGHSFDRRFENPVANLSMTNLSIGTARFVFATHEVPWRAAFLSIDIDGDDIEILEVILDAGWRFDLVEVEYSILLDGICRKCWDAEAKHSSRSAASMGSGL